MRMLNVCLTLVISLAGLLTLSVPAIAAADPAYLKFAQQVQDSINAGDSSLLDRQVDYDAIVDRAIGTYDVEQAFKDGFRKGVKSKTAEVGLGKQILTAIKGTGSYTYLRMVRVGNEDRALFRLLPAGNGVNYHGLVLQKGKSGEVKVIDFFNFMNGELMSETFRRGFVAIAAERQKGFLAKLIGREGEYVSNLPKIKEMQMLGQQGKFVEALQAYAALPPSVQKDKTIQVFRVTYASKLNDKQYTEAMDYYRRNFPGDASVDLVTLDGLIIAKKYAEAVAAIDRVNKNVGGDAYLGVLRANMYLLAGKYSLAKESARRAVADEPGLKLAYWSLVTIALEEKDYRETARLLATIENKLQIKLNDLQNNETYAGFVASPEYAAWMKGRGK